MTMIGADVPDDLDPLDVVVERAEHDPAAALERPVLADPVSRRGVLVGRDVELDVLQAVRDLHRELALVVGRGLCVPGRSPSIWPKTKLLQPALGLPLAVEPLPLDHDVRARRGPPAARGSRPP